MKNLLRYSWVAAVCLVFLAEQVHAQSSGGSQNPPMGQVRPTPRPPVRPFIPFPLRQPPVVGYLVVPSYGPYGWAPYNYPYYPYYYNPDYTTSNGSIMAPDSMYGPVGLRNFLGLDQQAAPRAPARHAASDEGPRPKVRETSADTKIIASKSLDSGDTYFGKQKYSSALERYRRAVQTAPDLAESYFREGHALVALGQYATAGKAFRKGLDIGPEWRESGFLLDQIYGENRMAKSSHFEALALAVEKNPRDANLQFVLGVELFFDGQAERARTFFERSVALGGNRDHLLDPFLHEGRAATRRDSKQPERVEF